MVWRLGPRLGPPRLASRRLVRRRLPQQPLLGLQGRYRRQRPHPRRKLFFQYEQDAHRQLRKDCHEHPHQDGHEGWFRNRDRDKGKFVRKARNEDHVFGKACNQDDFHGGQDGRQERQLHRLHLQGILFHPVRIHQERIDLQQVLGIPSFHLFQSFIQVFRERRDQELRLLRRQFLQVLRRCYPQQRRLFERIIRHVPQQRRL